MMGLEHQRNLNAIPNVEVVAAADPVQESLDWATLTAHDRPLTTFLDYRDLLAADLCDAYVISSPNFTHRAVLDDVMETGKAILVEKPLCTTVEDVHHIYRAAQNYPSVFWVGLEYRYMPPVRHIIDVAASGALGDIAMVAIREHRHPFLVKVGNWNRFSTNTGGTLTEKCCHFFDLMRLIARANPVRVMASGDQRFNHLDETYDGRTPDIMDNAFVIVEFDNGVRASLDLSMFAEGTVNNEEVSIVGQHGKAEAFIPSGIVRVGERTGWSAGVEEKVITDDRVLVEGFHHGASFLEHLDFADAIRQGTPALVGAEDGWWSVLVGLAAHRSIEERRVVELRELL
ncbi:MAG: Gfo/Idh/MocA family oxidoreductase [Acidobacteria bacterium]|nr:Gfo/Idh/MocA family oxidoreductase [Acidobacteriota bacterium]